jgi:hypothetical protein
MVLDNQSFVASNLERIIPRKPHIPKPQTIPITQPPSLSKILPKPFLGLLMKKTDTIYQSKRDEEYSYKDDKAGNIFRYIKPVYNLLSKDSGPKISKIYSEYDSQKKEKRTYKASP